MRVKAKTENVVRLASLRIGDVFCQAGKMYMVTCGGERSGYEKWIACVDLTGYENGFSMDAMVTPVAGAFVEE